MEDWQLDFEWLRIRHYVQDTLGRKDLPDMNGILFLIGIQELGQLHKSYTKEEKQDLMHVAICTLLADDGYFDFVGRDEDGWPHYTQLKNVDITGVEGQEKLLKDRIVKYFRALGLEDNQEQIIRNN